MAIGYLKPGQVSRPVRKTNKTMRVPAPMQGIDARVALSAGNKRTAIYSYNLQPYEFGMRIRKGYREIAKDLVIDPEVANGVHTIIPFDGIEESHSEDALFAVTNEGIWQVYTDGSTPVLKFTFANQDPNAGYGTYAHYITEAEDDILFYADSKNGLFTYDSSTGTWAQTVDITGPDVTNINFIVEHKQRLWLIEENSTKAWYLPVASNSGQAKEFFFGSKFKHGGNLVGLFNWSVDGGDGLDDYLVAVSRAGDVLPYKGDDPTSTGTWNVQGTYFIGEVPRGPNFATDQGGELFLLSSYGVVSMNDLLKGVDATNNSYSHKHSISAKIAGVLRNAAAKNGDAWGWSIKIIPSEGGMLISQPKFNSEATLQYYYNFAIAGWSFWRDVPMNSFDSYNNAVVIGTPDNRVGYMDVFVDDLLLDGAPEGLINGHDIEFSLMTSFQALMQEGHFKRVSLIRTDFSSQVQPSSNAEARYDWNVQEPTAFPEANLAQAGLWDEGIWSESYWGSRLAFGYNKLGGSVGHGRYVALALKGSSRQDLRFIGFDITFTVGGVLG